jgi:superfamily I DNA and/or RNA helicase
MALR